MSADIPPNPNVNFFNNEYWVNEATPLTQEIADTKYLRFPVAQGNEELLDVDVVGNATFQNTLTIANGANNSIVDMAGSNLTISNNVSSGNITLNVENSSGITDTTLVVSSTDGAKATGNGLAFSAQNSGLGLNTGILRMGVGSSLLYNGIVQANDSAVVGTSTSGINNGALVLTTQSNIANSGGIRITQPTINMRGDNIQLNANTTLTSTTTQPLSNDSSTHIPTTAWVQSAISGGALASPMPYYQAYYFLNAPANFDRYATFQFNFTGTNWGINDYFSISLRCSLITTTNNTAVAPNYATFNTIIDVYPARCPANNTNPSAYGVNPTQPNTTNFSLLNGSIYNGGLQSAYVLTSNGLPYVPYGRWYYSNNYTIWTTGTSYPTTSPSPIAPYIQYGTAEKSAFGFGLWGSSFVYSEFAINIQVINRGPNGVGQGITLSSNYTTGGGNTLNEVKVGL
jgi:hypothetical protein